jgi:hypothetical protein
MDINIKLNDNKVINTVANNVGAPIVTHVVNPIFCWWNIGECDKAA